MKLGDLGFNLIENNDYSLYLPLEYGMYYLYGLNKDLSGPLYFYFKPEFSWKGRI